MKKKIVIPVLIACFLFVTCSSQVKNNEEVQNAENQDSILTTQVEEISKSAVIEIETEEEFIEKIAQPNSPSSMKYKGEKPCVIDFFATWCVPCKKMEPAYEKLAKEYADKVIFYRIDVDKMKDVAQKVKIMGMPTLFFCTKENINVVVGMQTEEQLRNYLDNL